jgi:hypothetical protein
MSSRRVRLRLRRSCDDPAVVGRRAVDKRLHIGGDVPLDPAGLAVGVERDVGRRDREWLRA